ncbi:MAG: head-tail connector protein [Eubacterium sp.]|nr:head-tail connector protein [Eubacterium sp.]MCH4078695.1 head-tail connector protein [Eubacterium sp.]MCH4109836.1 head-tail connector protein [Eubacterium sp.]MCI1307044.1 head-tail connector protein [Eubacterium sp.]
MIVTVDEMKNYLRVDDDADDDLIKSIIGSSEKLCADILRVEELPSQENTKVAVMYAAAYLYEHREEADHHALIITLRALLFGDRKAEF